MQVSKQVATFITTLTFAFTIMTAQASDKTPTLEQDVAQRQAAFSQIEELQEKVDSMLDSAIPNWQELENTSASITTSSASLQRLFVSGSQLDSKAKDKVWSDNQKFKAALAKMDNSFVMMDNAIAQQDKSAAKSALKQANKTCRNCHRQYRSRW
ncbi:cytochrome c [Moritella sp. 24]|uniref:cytochrome c n=1 Tax=Moritella sp. 24 TaxID=2746230 RepID=UPI001BA4B120|nr:cytochrome c [Moritella sp. 24]QUM77155.1 cytochrome c [Moritella sp. 24]